MHQRIPPRFDWSAFGFIALLLCCSTFGQSAKSSANAPLMSLLPRFTAPDVPKLGPAETEVATPRWSTNLTAPPASLPGKGLAQHPMLYIGEGYNKIFLINEG